MSGDSISGSGGPAPTISGLRLEVAPDDPFERPASHTDLGNRETVPEEDGHHVRETGAETRLGILGVDVAQGVGQTQRGEDVVEHDRHLVAEMTTVPGQQLIAGRRNLAAEEHEAE